ncbi:hypothetical protein BDY24DRAFT_441594 [Mrakia frigida]|uniref:uncharacterized protein n=1 Tax=Mrakia frigida TaxID=29902 RepID=UPI003FCC26B9
MTREGGKESGREGKRNGRSALNELSPFLPPPTTLSPSPSMPTPPEISPEKKKTPRRVVEDVGRIRGALSDTTHLLDSFKDSLGSIVIANKAAKASIEELVEVCKEERRESKVAMEKIGELASFSSCSLSRLSSTSNYSREAGVSLEKLIPLLCRLSDQHIQKQSTLPSELASLKSLSSTAASEQSLTSSRLEKVELALANLGSKLASSENVRPFDLSAYTPLRCSRSSSFFLLPQSSTETSIAKLSQTQSDLSTAVLQLSSTVTQISHSQTQISQTQAQMLILLQRLDARPSAPHSGSGVTPPPNIYVKIMDGVAGVIEGSERKRRREWDEGSARGGSTSSEENEGEGRRGRSESAIRSDEEGREEKRLRRTEGEVPGLEMEEEEVDQIASSSSVQGDGNGVASVHNDRPPFGSESVQNASPVMGSGSGRRDHRGREGIVSSFLLEIESSSPLEPHSSPGTYPAHQEAPHSISLTLPNRGSSLSAAGSSPRGEKQEPVSTTSSASKKKPLVRRKKKETQDEDIVPFDPSSNSSLVESPFASKSKATTSSQAGTPTPTAKPLSNHNSNRSPPGSFVAGPSKTVVAFERLFPPTPSLSASSLAVPTKPASSHLGTSSSISPFGPGLSKILAATATSSKPPVVGFRSSSSIVQPNLVSPLPTSFSKPPTQASATTGRRHRILIAEEDDASLSQSASASQRIPWVSEPVLISKPASARPTLPPLSSQDANGYSITPPSGLPPFQSKKKRMLLLEGGSTQEDDDEEDETMDVDGAGMGRSGGGGGGRGDAGLQALEKAMREDDQEGIGSQGAGSLGA